MAAAGLAEGDHRDHEDFYEQLKRQCGTKTGREALLPTAEDLRLLRRETVAKILTDWERLVQELARRLLEQAMRDGHSRLAVPHPTEPAPLTTVDLEFSADDDIEEFVLSFIDHTQRGSQLAYLLERRLLTSIAPP